MLIMNIIYLQFYNTLIFIQREQYEKQILELKTTSTKYQNKSANLLIEKKTMEEKYNKLSDQYQKIIQSGNTNKKIVTNNSIEILETLKNNDLLKILSKFKGTEKLIETCKNGFNESLRELLFEISALKNFIFDVNQEMCNFINIKVNDLSHKCVYLDQSLIQMPFLDIIHKVKKIYRNNMDIALYRREPVCEVYKEEGEDNYVENNDDEEEEEEKPKMLNEAKLANKPSDNRNINKNNNISNNKNIIKANNDRIINKGVSNNILNNKNDKGNDIYKGSLFEKNNDRNDGNDRNDNSISLVSRDRDDDRENLSSLSNFTNNDKYDNKFESEQNNNYEELENLKKKWMNTLLKK